MIERFLQFVDKPSEPVKDAIFCTQRGMVETHLFTFESLWCQAIPAHLRIKELERGIQPEVLHTIMDPNAVIETAYKLVTSAREEILMVFHTANAFLRQERSGRIDLLVENAIKYKIQIKILVPVEDKIADIIQRLEHINGIQVRKIEPAMQTRMTILIIDRKHSLVIELRDDDEEDSEQAMGLSTYSNSKSTVLSYVSIFDTLWKQTELREELLNRSMAQEEFINVAAHELRNPIQPILSLSDILQRSDTSSNSGSTEFKMTDQQKEMIAIIARNARRLERLAEDILDVVKIDGKTLKLNKEKFVLSEAIEEIVGDYAMDIRDS
ncbi:MAG TPA: histidine kinase dimerization/phospho-acceptor domain-containing protein, partial [Nitrososphaeraceae archaeon]|nr:histidine kinase dimerization/phospho-acceptor domain-containing protein [Nitrososphaeraceae archaeon]